MSNIGLIASNEFKNVLIAKPFDLSFSADFNMFKIKEERWNEIGETTDFDHALGYFPFYLAYVRNTSITDGKTLAFSTGSYVTPQSGEITSHGYMFVCFNPGAN